MEQQKDLVSVVFPTMNRKEDLIKCIKSIKTSTYKKIEIVISDNCSTDGSQEAVKKRFPEVILLENELNLGSPIAINNCIKVSKGEFILRLDDDIIIEKDMIKKMLEVLKSDSRVGAVSALCFYTENPEMLRNAGMKINLFLGKTKVYGKNETNVEPYKENIERDLAGGGTTMVKRPIYDEIGFYDENYFLTYEDVDWCMKLKKANYKLIMIGSAKIYHKKELNVSQAEDPVRIYFNNRGQVLFMKKNAGYRNIIFFPYLLCFLYPIKVIRFLFKWNILAIKYLTKGIFDALFNERTFVYNEEGKQVLYEGIRK